MITVVLSLTAAVGWAFHDFLVQPVTRRAGAFTAMFWVLAASTVILMAFSLALGGVPSGGDEWRAIGIAAVGGVLYVLGVAVLLHGLQVGNLSVVTPLCSLMGGVTALAVILLGERVGTLSAVALPLAVIGVLLTSLVTPEEEAVEEDARGPADARRRRGRRGDRHAATGVSEGAAPAPARKRRLRATAGAGWGLLAAVLFGTTFLVYGYADGIPAVSAAAWGRLTGMAVFLPFALLRVPLRMQPRLYVSTTVAACLDSVAYTAIAAALVIGPGLGGIGAQRAVRDHRAPARRRRAARAARRAPDRRAGLHDRRGHAVRARGLTGYGLTGYGPPARGAHERPGPPHAGATRPPTCRAVLAGLAGGRTAHRRHASPACSARQLRGERARLHASQRLYCSLGRPPRAAVTASWAVVISGAPQPSQGTSSRVRPHTVRVVAVSSTAMHPVGHAATQEPQPTHARAAVWPNGGPTCLPCPRPMAARAL